MSGSAQKTLGTIDSFLAHVGSMQKSAAAPLSEPGSIGGETSHPVKSVDDRLQKAKEGERSAENSKDVKADQGPPSVENAGENKTAAERSLNLLHRLSKKAGESANPPGTAEEDQLQIGTNKAPTGEDPANETSSAKAGKEDPGSSHPARTDNDSLDGHKYAYDANTPLEKMAADLQEIGDDLCARLEIAADNMTKTAGVAATGTHSGNGATQAAKPQGTKQASALDPRLAQQAGWEIAGILNGTMDKSAADKMVQAELSGIIKEAFDDADNVAEFFRGRAAQMRKRANADEAGADPASGGAGPGPGADSGGAGPVPGPDSMGGGEGMGAGPDAGGMGGGMGGGQVSPQDVDAICQELGCTPEDLLDALMQTAGGGPAGAGGLGGAPGPDAGGAGADPAAAMGGAMGGGAGAPGGATPPMPPAGGMEVAASDKGKKPLSKSAAHVIDVVKEVIQRSKR